MWVCMILSPLVVITGSTTVSLLTSKSWLPSPTKISRTHPCPTAPYHIGKYNANMYPHTFPWQHTTEKKKREKKTLKQTPKWVHTLTNHHWWILKINRDHPSELHKHQSWSQTHRKMSFQFTKIIYYTPQVLAWGWSGPCMARSWRLYTITNMQAYVTRYATCNKQHALTLTCITNFTIDILGISVLFDNDS